MKGKPNKYNTVGTVPKSNRKFTETEGKLKPLSIYITAPYTGLVHFMQGQHTDFDYPFGIFKLFSAPSLEFGSYRGLFHITCSCF